MDLRFYVLATAAFLSGANLRVFDSLFPNIAAEYGVSAERIRQLEKNAMKKVRALIED